MSIQVDHVTKRFGTFTVLNDVSLHAQAGELIALLGPSGCGKTTLLRILAGLERPDQGRILLHGIEVTDQRITDRRVGFVFQHYALFRHMTVTENVAFGLSVLPRAQRPSPDQIQKKVDELLSLVQMRAMADRYPNQLSGGQRQRVALARALAVEPKMLLLDEPFGALDTKVRKELRRWLRRLHDELHITSILVTHDQEEALEAADRIVVLNQGHIEQIGTPEEVYEHPATPFVYRFSAMSTCFMAGLLKTRPRTKRRTGNLPRRGTLQTNTKSPLSVPTTWNSAGAGPRRHRSRRPCDLSSPPDRASASSWSRRTRRKPLRLNSPKSVIASYGFNKAMWSLCTRNNYKYSKCPAPCRCNSVPMDHEQGYNGTRLVGN